MDDLESLLDLDNRARAKGVDPDLARAVISEESSWDPKAVSHDKDTKQPIAYGLMQLTPETAHDMGVKNLFDPVQNVDGGLEYLSRLQKKYGGDKRKVLAAWNWGPGHVDQAGAERVPRETHDFRDRVLKRVGQGAAKIMASAVPAAQADEVDDAKRLHDELFPELLDTSGPAAAGGDEDYDEDAQKAIALHDELFPELKKPVQQKQESLKPPREIGVSRSVKGSLELATYGLGESVFYAPEAAGRISKGAGQFIRERGTPPGDGAVATTARAISSSLESVGQNVEAVGKEFVSPIGEKIKAYTQERVKDDPDLQVVVEQGEYGDKAIDAALKGDFDPLKSVVKSPEILSSYVAQAAPSLALAMVSGGSYPVMALLEGLEGVSNARDYEKRTGHRMTDEQFAAAISFKALVGGYLERLGALKVLEGGPVKGAVSEAATELTQNWVGNIAQGIYDPEAALLPGSVQSAVGGGGAGLGAGLLKAVLPGKQRGTAPHAPVQPPPGAAPPPAQNIPHTTPSSGPVTPAATPNSPAAAVQPTQPSAPSAAPVVPPGTAAPTQPAAPAAPQAPAATAVPPTAVTNADTSFIDQLLEDAANDRIPDPEAIDKAGKEAATSPANDRPEPTPLQKDAGNYKKGHIKLHGLDIAIENPKGSTRSGVDSEGKPWESPVLPVHYGYIKRTQGADGDHVDAYVGPHPMSDKVWIINQQTPDGKKFDEHKILLGFNDVDGAKRAYLDTFSDDVGSKVFKSISPELSVADLKERLPHLKKAQPVASDEAVEQTSDISGTPEAKPAEKPAPKFQTGTDATVYDENNKAYKTQYALAEADDLTPTFGASENQARDRTRAASEAQIASIAGNLNYDRVAASADLGTGAPTLAQDGRVVAGNGRIAAIQRAYGEGKAEDYRTRLNADAASKGLNAEGFKKPVLVRVLPHDANVREAALLSNEGGAARMSELEQARVDAERLPDLGDLEFNDAGDFNTQANQGIFRALLKSIPVNQQGAFIGKGGTLSQEGVRRIRNALLHRAYGDSETLTRLVESTDEGQRNIANAFVRLAPRVAKIKASIEQGALHDGDISQDLTTAAEKFAQLKTDGQTVEQFLSQGDMLGHGMSEDAIDVLKLLDTNAKSAKRLADTLNAYYDALEQAEDPRQSALFAAEPPSKRELLRRANEGQTETVASDAGPREAVEADRSQPGKNAPAPESRPDQAKAEKAGVEPQQAAEPKVVKDAAKPRKSKDAESDVSAERPALYSRKPKPSVEVRDFGSEALNGKRYAVVRRNPNTGEAHEYFGTKGEAERSATPHSVHRVIRYYENHKDAAAMGAVEDERKRAIKTADQAYKLASIGQLKQIKSREGLCYECAAVAAYHTGGDMVIGEEGSGPDRIWHAIVKYKDGTTYDPTMGRFFAPDVYEEVFQFKPARTFDKSQLIEFGQQEGAVPSATLLGIGQDAEGPLYSRKKQATTVDSTQPPEFNRWFKNSKVVDADGNPLRVYHGAQRPDRIGTRFRKARATSGPMSFFTDNPEQASGYATSKSDTSLEQPADYAEWFKYRPKGMRSDVDIDRAWYHLTPEQRATLTEKLPHVTNYDENNDEMDGYRLGGPDEYGLAGAGHWQHSLKEARGNMLKAAKEIWLNSGALFGDEQDFMEVLRLAGAPMKDIQYDHPYAQYPAVIPVYLSIQKPLDTQAIPDGVMSALQTMARRNRTRPQQYGQDTWDKRTRDIRDWVQQLGEDRTAGRNSHVWTSIPDKITEVLRVFGYDGIKDLGGKLGGAQHYVWIPFEENQIKSATGNRGTFDPESNNILYSRKKQTAAPTDDLLTTYDNADILEREQQAKDAATAEAEAQKQAEGKARSEREAENFTLSGSNSDADQAAAAGQGSLFSRKAATQKAYDSRIDQLFDGEAPEREGIKVLDRSDILSLLGYGDKPVHLAEGKVAAGRFNHLLTPEHWKKIPEWLDNPVAVFDSDTVPGRLVAIAPELVDGKPIVMIMHPNALENGMHIHLLVNAYERGTPLPVTRWVDEGKLRYLDQRKSPGFRTTSGLRLPRVLQEIRGSRDKRIFTERDLVKLSGQPLASRTVTQGGMSVAAVKSAIAKVSSKWDVPINVVETAADLPGNHPDDVEGLYQDGQVYLVASNLPTEARAIQTIMHESVGHLAVEQTIDGREYRSALNSVNQMDRLGHKVIRELGQIVDERQPGLDAQTRAKEILALAVEQGRHKTFTAIQKIVARITRAIKNFLRRIGLNANLSEQEIFSMLRTAESNLERPERGSAPQEAYASRKKQPPAAPFTPAAEKSYQEASKGIRGDVTAKSRVQDVVQNIKDAGSYMKAIFSSPYTTLPRTGKFALAHETLRRFEQAMDNAKGQSVRMMHDILQNLSPEEYDTFQRAVILNDLQHDVAKKMPLPDGFTPTSIATDLATVQQAITPKIQASLDARKRYQDDIRDKLIAAEILKPGQVDNQSYFHHQVLAYARQRERMLLAKGRIRKPKPGFTKQRKGTAELFNMRFIESEFEFLTGAKFALAKVKTLNDIRTDYDTRDQYVVAAKAHNLKLVNDELGRNPAFAMQLGMFRARGDKVGATAYIKQYFGKRLRSWQDMMPDGVEAWQPDEGNYFYRGLSVEDRTIQAAIQAAGSLVDPTGSVAAALAKVRSALMVGGPKEQMAIPVELKDTLEGMKAHEKEGFAAVADWLSRQLTSRWKQWVLIKPDRWAKYNLNNISGDLDTMIGGAPKIFMHLPQAARETWDFIKSRPSVNVLSALDAGVMDNSLEVMEVEDVGRLQEFERLVGESPTVPVKAVRALWNALQGSTRFRENTFRLAVYLHYRHELVDLKKTPEQLNYGASPPDMVDALYAKDPEQAAAAMARELMVDYRAISAAGKQLRAHAIPFWSWQEGNLRRYFHLINNAFRFGGVGPGARASASTIAGGALRGAFLSARLLTYYMILQGIGSLGDDDDKPDPFNRAQIHVPLGKDKDGIVQSLRLQGSLSDIMSWAGLEDVIPMLEEIEHGRASYGDLVKNMAKAPINKLVGGINPLWKTPVELMSGRTYWPDAFDPKIIKDRKREVTKTLGLEDEYDVMAGLPTRGYLESWKNALVYGVDEDENAYNRIQSLSYRYKNFTTGKDSPAAVPDLDVYYYKQALRFGDKEAAERFKPAAMKALKRPDQSFDRLRPLGNLTTQQRDQFMMSLGPRERDMLVKAQKWYDDVYGEALTENGQATVVFRQVKELKKAAEKGARLSPESQQFLLQMEGKKSAISGAKLQRGLMLRHNANADTSVLDGFILQQQRDAIELSHQHGEAR